MHRRSVLALLLTAFAGCSFREESTTPPPSPASPAPTPWETSYVFVDEPQLRMQQRRVENGVEPFATAYENLVDSADSALETRLLSITDDTDDNHGPHRFEANTNDRADYLSAVRMSDAARNCAIAYWFTGDDEYARRTIDIVHHWFLADETYMEPVSDVPNAATPIEQWITIPAFVYAASFVRGHSHWGEYDGSRPWDNGSSDGAEAAFGRWLRDWHATFPESLPGYCVTNNKWPWRITNKATVAAYLGDDSIMSTAKQMYQAETMTECPDGSSRPRPWTDYVSVDEQRGYFKTERDRENSFQYTSYNLLAHAMCCTAFAVWDGSDLWNFNAPTDPAPGPTLWKAYNWYLPFLTDTSKWEWNETSISEGDIEQGATAFELAYARWNNFEEGIDTPARIGGRPHTDRRVLGPVTLTHGEY